MSYGSRATKNIAGKTVLITGASAGIGQATALELAAAAKAGPVGTPVRFVQIGTASATDITLPGAILRSSAIELMGSGIGSISLERLLDKPQEKHREWHLPRDVICFLCHQVLT